ncbi:lysozyme c-1-like [Leptopilina heterotoma]|uniref:lysozyme c-1-like n=1 Tax=Leptopilina heterotoma TaxID=63436 RepID=UPI001CA84B9D|nr:lysozyme c-1-like [Leptopilina heterotoma]
MRIRALFSLSLIFFLSREIHISHGKILTRCEAAKELIKGGVSRTFVSNFVCLMEKESGLDTKKITGPKAQSSYSFGVFQISSGKWCTRGRAGGLCMKKCEDFADDNIQDDIVCARKIQEKEGFKYWSGWLKKCKNQTLPNVSNCKRRRKR